MIGSRRLINEIPSGKFHSALMTSYSINLYYWESQLLKTLSKKGINYVSAVVDSDCLSEQLYYFNSARENRAPKFGLHGFKSNGAFHPKIQFYAGKSSILVLVGSGNISISGHGKNLEIWNPIMVDSKESPLFPLVMGVWDYLCKIYRSLGPEAVDIVETVKENCELLKEAIQVDSSDCKVNDELSLRFFANGENTLMDQCQDWIGKERIKSIVVMSPFHDKKAVFIENLIDLYHPEVFDLILQKGFGLSPDSDNIPSIVNVMDWGEMKSALELRQKYFHAKCIFLEGEQNSYLICGSANSSIAAFGRLEGKPINHEACIGYKTPRKSFYELVGMPRPTPIDRSKLEHFPKHEQESNNKATMPTLWIKEASWEYKKITVTIQFKQTLTNLQLSVYSGNRSKVCNYNIESIVSDEQIVLQFDAGFIPLLVEIKDKSGNLISNRQFVISSMSMQENNPSPENSQHRRMCNDLESGRFITDSIFNFIYDILLRKKPAPSKSPEAEDKDKRKGEKAHQYESYDAYMSGNKAVDTSVDRMRRVMSSSLKSTMLMDSIMSYVTRSSAQKQMSQLDHEETENAATSQGRTTNLEDDVDVYTDIKSERIKTKVISMFDKYIEQTLELSHLPKKKQGQLLLSNAMEKISIILLYVSRCLSYRYDTDAKKGLCIAPIPAGPHSVKSLTHYLYKAIDSFSLLVFRYNFGPEDHEYALHRIEDLRPSILSFALAMISVLDWLNEENLAYQEYSLLYKHSSLMNIKKAIGMDDYIPTVSDVFSKIDCPIQEMSGFDQSVIEGIIRSNIDHLTSGSDRVYFSEEYGYVSLRPYKLGMHFPCSLIFDYNKEKSLYCPDSVYSEKTGKIHPLQKKHPY